MLNSRFVVLILVAATTGCTGITDSLQIVQPLEATLGAEQRLSVVIKRSDPDFDEADAAKFSNMLLPDLQRAGVAGTVTAGESSDATLQLLVEINDYESTTTMGRFWFGVMAGPAIFQAALTLTASADGASLSAGLARAQSAGWGITAGTNTQTYPAVVRRIVEFLKQAPR